MRSPTTAYYGLRWEGRAIGPEHIVGQRPGIPSQARDFFFEKPIEIVILTAHVLGKYRPGGARQRRSVALPIFLRANIWGIPIYIALS
jgi:hypothetical protein